MIFGYVRVSTEEQAKDERTSPADQERKIRGYGMMVGGEVQIHADLGVSGAVPFAERPEGSKIWQAAKAGDFLVAAAMDRAFRSCRDALTVVEEARQRGIKMVLLNIHTDPVGDPGIGEFIFATIAAAAQLDKYMILRRMTDGKQGKRARNGHIGGQAPYGYQVQGSGRESVLIECEPERKVIDLMVDLRTQGQRPLAVVSSELERRGIVNRKGKPFAPNQIKRIVERSVPAMAAE